MQSVKHMNNLLREKNNEILRNLQLIKDEIEFRNKEKQLQIKEAYTNLAENNRTLLNGLRTRNNNFIRTNLTPYEKEYGYSRKLDSLQPISHFSTFVKSDSPTNRDIIVGNFEEAQKINASNENKIKGMKRQDTSDALDEIIRGFENGKNGLINN